VPPGGFIPNWLPCVRALCASPRAGRDLRPPTPVTTPADGRPDRKSLTSQDVRGGGGRDVRTDGTQLAMRTSQPVRQGPAPVARPVARPGAGSGPARGPSSRRARLGSPPIWLASDLARRQRRPRVPRRDERRRPPRRARRLGTAPLSTSRSKRTTASTIASP